MAAPEHKLTAKQKRIVERNRTTRKPRATRTFDPAGVLAAIRERKQQGKPMTSTSVLTGPHVDTPLIFHARKYFGSWYDAAGAAGIETPPSKRDPDQTAESIYQDIRRRQEAEPLSGHYQTTILDEDYAAL
jgi:hypothetical protein